MPSKTLNFIAPDFRISNVTLSALAGATAVVFSIFYFLSDLIELSNGGFSTPQLALTYAAEAAIPIFVLGLYAAQRPRIGALGLVGATAYAYVYVYFASTVVYAMVNNTADWDQLSKQLGLWLTVHSVLMVLAGIVFGVAVIRAEAVPQWTGIALIVGMVAMAVSTGMPDVLQTAAAAIRDFAFVGMGAALVRQYFVGRGNARSTAKRSSQ